MSLVVLIHKNHYKLIFFPRLPLGLHRIMYYKIVPFWHFHVFFMLSIISDKVEENDLMVRKVLIAQPGLQITSKGWMDSDFALRSPNNWEVLKWQTLSHFPSLPALLTSICLHAARRCHISACCTVFAVLLAPAWLGDTLVIVKFFYLLKQLLVFCPALIFSVFFPKNIVKDL